MVFVIIWNSAQMGYYKKHFIYFGDSRIVFADRLKRLYRFCAYQANSTPAMFAMRRLRDRLLGDILIGQLGYRLNSLALSKDRVSRLKFMLYLNIKLDQIPTKFATWDKQNSMQSEKISTRSINRTNVKKILPVHTNWHEFSKNGSI